MPGRLRAGKAIPRAAGRGPTPGSDVCLPLLQVRIPPLLGKRKGDGKGLLATTSSYNYTDVSVGVGWGDGPQPSEPREQPPFWLLEETEALQEQEGVRRSQDPATRWVWLAFCFPFLGLSKSQWTEQFLTMLFL